MNKEVAHVKQGDLLNQQLEKDQKPFVLEHFLKGQSSSNYILPPTGNFQQLIAGHLTRFPDTIAKIFDDTDPMITFQGIFPEINCAWITKNNILYLWEYTDGRGVLTYGDQDQVICSVGLVKPKPGVKFNDPINYVLVVATPLHITLLGIEYNNPVSQVPGDAVKVHATQFSATCDNIQMTSIYGTDTGRIFMCGSDCHLYELGYSSTRYRNECSIISHSKPQPSFFLPRLPRMLFHTPIPSPGFKSFVVDNERCILYGLTNKSTIDIYNLGPSKTELNCVSKGGNITLAARSKCHQIDHDESHFNIDYIYAVPQNESKMIHLIAVTMYGYRLYLTRNPLQKDLTLIHVRSPPSRFDSTQNPYPELNMSSYGNGVFMASQELTNSDKIYMTSAILIQSTPSLPSISTEQPLPSTTTGPPLTSASSRPLLLSTSTEEQPLFTEIVFETSTIGKVWAMAEHIVPDMHKYPICDNGSQYLDATRELLVLTDHGLTRLKKPRPIDTLYNILLDAKDKLTGKDCQAFFERHGPTEACAMCLSVICGSDPTLGPDSYSIRKLAIEAFFVFGGDPSELPPPILPGNYLGRPVARMGVKYSNKHDGLALYFARLVSKVWRSNVFEMVLDSSSNTILADLLITKGNLIKLKDFMDSLYQPYLIDLDDHDYPLLLAEKQSVQGLYGLLTRCIDALSLLDIVMLPNLISVIKCAPESLQSRMMKLTMESMVLSPDGAFLINEWVIAAIVKSGFSCIQPGYDVVSHGLQAHCGSFYDANHISFYKGLEGLACAKSADKGYERAKALEESLKHFSDMAGIIPTDRFDSICWQYRQQGYYLGVLSLALKQAIKVDPQNQGLDYLETCNPFNTSTHPNDTQMRHDNSVKYYEERSHCYQHILQCFSQIKRLQKGQSVDGQHHFDYDPHVLASRFLFEAISSSDVLFHYTLYHWLFKRYLEGDSLDELLSIQTSYIIQFFEQYANEYEGLEFLWQYSRRWNKHLESALYLEALALKKPNQDADARITYIGLALMEVRMAAALSPDVAPEDLAILSCRLDQHRDRLMCQA